MKLEVECRINVGGEWWDIMLENYIDPKKSTREKLDHIDWFISALKSSGKIISRVGGDVSAKPPSEGHPSPANGNAAAQPSFTWPPPQCKVHREAMMPSKTQKKEGYTMYFCAKRLGEGYCGQRAGVENSTAIPKFWEVKQAV